MDTYYICEREENVIPQVPSAIKFIYYDGNGGPDRVWPGERGITMNASYNYAIYSKGLVVNADSVDDEIGIVFGVTKEIMASGDKAYWMMSASKLREDTEYTVYEFAEADIKAWRERLDIRNLEEVNWPLSRAIAKLHKSLDKEEASAVTEMANAAARIVAEDEPLTLVEQKNVMQQAIAAHGTAILDGPCREFLIGLVNPLMYTSVVNMAKRDGCYTSTKQLAIPAAKDIFEELHWQVHKHEKRMPIRNITIKAPDNLRKEGIDGFSINVMIEK